MPQEHAIHCLIDLPGGRHVIVGMTVIEEPLLPTPGEPDVERAPHLHEWADIVAKLGSLQINIIQKQS